MESTVILNKLYVAQSTVKGGKIRPNWPPSEKDLRGGEKIF